MDPPRESEEPSSSRTTQNVARSNSRAINRAVSNILPSSSNQQSNQATGILPTRHTFGSASGRTTASGLSSIHTRQTASDPTSPDVHLHAPQLPLVAPYASGQPIGNLATHGTGSTPASDASIFTRQTTWDPTSPDVHFHAPQFTLGAPYAYGEATGNLPTHCIYGSATESTPASGLSLSPIPTRQALWESTLPDVHLRGPQLTLGAPYASGQATQNFPTHSTYGNAMASTPASGLSPSSILTRQAPWEPTSPDVHLHAPQLTFGAPYASGQGESTLPDVHLRGPQLTLDAPFASGQATQNFPTHNIYGNAMASTPASGLSLSSILTRQAPWEPTSPDVHLHARQLTFSAPYASGQATGNLPTRVAYIAVQLEAHLHLAPPSLPDNLLGIQHHLLFIYMHLNSLWVPLMPMDRQQETCLHIAYIVVQLKAHLHLASPSPQS